MQAQTRLLPNRFDAQNANVRGLAYLAIGFFMFSTSDMIAKFLADGLHPVQIVWSRQLGLMAGAIVLLLINGPSLLRTAFPILQVVRGGLVVISAVLFVTAISFVPLADAVAVTFVAPFMVTILGMLILGEQVGIRRWGAIVLGFIGALVIIRPGLDVFHPAMFLVLLAAVSFALRQVLSRKLASSDRTLTTIAYTAFVSVAILTIPVPFFWQWPSAASTYWMMAALTLFAAGGEIMVIRAFEVAEAVVVAPMHYSLILWATFYGWMVFDQLPDLWTWVGTAIIFATGIYLINRERMVKRGVV